MNCPKCSQVCQEESNEYYNTIRYSCFCPAQNSTKGLWFTCEVYKANKQIHLMYVHLDKVSLSLENIHRDGRCCYQWSIKTYASSAPKVQEIARGYDFLTPKDAVIKATRYQNLLTFS